LFLCWKPWKLKGILYWSWDIIIVFFKCSLHCWKASYIGFLIMIEQWLIMLNIMERQYGSLSYLFIWDILCIVGKLEKENYNSFIYFKNQNQLLSRWSKINTKYHLILLKAEVSYSFPLSFPPLEKVPHLDKIISCIISFENETTNP